MDMREAAQDPAFGRLPLPLRQALMWMTERDPHRRPVDMRIVRAVLERELLCLRVKNKWVKRLIPLKQSIPALARPAMEMGGPTSKQKFLPPPGMDPFLY